MHHLGTLRRLNKEHADLLTKPEEGVSAGPRLGEKLFPHWDGFIHGPEHTPYEGGIFKLSITIPTDYPFKPPRVTFVTKVLHCNIDQWGRISLDILTDKWTPSLTIKKVLISIRFLLDDPNPDDPLVPHLAMLFKKNPDEYYKQVREAVLKYAVPQEDPDSNNDETREGRVGIKYSSELWSCINNGFPVRCGSADMLVQGMYV